jgi:hypothetical protein
MHPEVRQIGPGSCPICGMALEPVEASLEEEPNHELIDMSRRFWWSLALTAPILAFMVSEFLPRQPLQHAIPANVATWIEFVLATPVVLWGGWPFFVRGWASIVSRHLNMFTLIALGVGAAYLFSVVATIAPRPLPGLVPRAWSSRRLLRARLGHRCPRAARAGPRVASTEPHQQRDSRPARTRAKDRSQDSNPIAPSTTFRSSTCTSAIGCASALASMSLLTVS